MLYRLTYCPFHSVKQTEFRIYQNKNSEWYQNKRSDINNTVQSSMKRESLPRRKEQSPRFPFVTSLPPPSFLWALPLQVEKFPPEYTSVN